jgi:putative ABC transport system substrate-binding protein
VKQDFSRRAFVTIAAALAGTCAIGLAPRSARAQQPAPPRRVGVLMGSNRPEDKAPLALRQALLDAGYVEGRDLVIEWRSALGDQTQLPRLAADLVQKNVDVIVTLSMPAARAAKRATSSIPIVLGIVPDPISAGLVTSLAHPGGNVTGLSAITEDLSAKRLQLLKEALPRLARVSVLWNPDTSFHKSVVEQLKAAGRSLSIELKFVGVRTPGEIGPAFSTATRAQPQAVYVVEDLLFFRHRTTLLKLATHAHLPILYWVKEFAQQGGLLSYGPSYEDLMRRAAGYVDRILKAAKPGDLPIEQPTKFELVVNLEAANALGIRIPESVLLRADEIIR